MKLVAQNRKVFFDYTVLDTISTGLVLRGWQVKSIKAGQVSLHDAYCYIVNSELFLRGLQITPWKGMSDLERKKAGTDIKLLARKGEILKLAGQLGKKGEGATIVPSRIALDHGLVKIEINLVKGKRQFDKRQKIKEREQVREIKRDISQKNW